MNKNNHRLKLLKNHTSFLRCVYGKKSRYIYAGIYLTESLTLPDRCLYYTDSRHDSSKQGVITRIKNFLKQYKTSKRVILDVGLRKRIKLPDIL